MSYRDNPRQRRRSKQNPGADGSYFFEKTFTRLFEIGYLLDKLKFMMREA